MWIWSEGAGDPNGYPGVADSGRERRRNRGDRAPQVWRNVVAGLCQVWICFILSRNAHLDLRDADAGGAANLPQLDWADLKWIYYYCLPSLSSSCFSHFLNKDIILDSRAGVATLLLPYVELLGVVPHLDGDPLISIFRSFMCFRVMKIQSFFVFLGLPRRPVLLAFFGLPMGLNCSTIV